MTVKYFDRVIETTTTSGAGTLTLLGPLAGFRSFSIAGNGARVGYVIDETTKWEVGIGTVTVGSPNTLARTTVLASSNSGALENFGNNVKNVRMAPLAPLVMGRDEALNFTDLMGVGGGTANAHTVIMPVTPLAYTDGAMIMYRATAVNTAAGVTVNVMGPNSTPLGAKSLKINGTDPAIGLFSVGTLILAVYNINTGVFDIINDPGPLAGKIKIDLTTDIIGVLPAANGASGNVPVRQTVLQSPIDAAGMPTFLPATSVNLNLTSQNISAGLNAFVVTAAQGITAALSGAVNRTGFSTTNLTWTGLAASTTNYLYVDIDAAGALTTGFTTQAPIYQFGGAPAVTSGQFTFNIQQMSGFNGNGNTAPAVYRVFVGEATTNASAVTSTIAYALMGRYVGTDTIYANSTRYDLAHNMGLSYGVETRLHMVNVTTEGGYVPGDIATALGFYGGTNFDSNNTPIVPNLVGRNTASVNFGAGNYIMHRSSGAGIVALTPANWKYRVLTWRTW